MEIVDRWKLRWQTLDLRVVILISLSLQILSIFLASLRKRMSKAWITMTIWCAYLLADATANFAAGLIFHSQGKTSGPSTDPTLLAFWAPFLLVHLGGPDTITAFALEDNELWLRHFLSLGFQCWVVGYAFVQSFPNHKLWIPTLLIFIAGVIKYFERTRALYLASSRIIKDSFLTNPDPGPNYAKFMDEYASKVEAKLPTVIEMIPEPPSNEAKEDLIEMIPEPPSNEAKEDLSADQKKEREEVLSCLEVVQTAHKYYTTFKGLIADLIFSISQRKQSRDYFLKRTARDAFHIIEVELNFFYDIHYTKARVVQGRFLGYPLRIISFSLTCAALVLFRLIEKKKFYKFDIAVSYTLLIGALALDLIAFLMILFSDWTVVALTKLKHPNGLIKILQCLLNVNRVRWPENLEQKPKWFSSRKIMHIVRLRWSNSLSQYNLINYCLHPRIEWWEKTIAFFSLTNMLDGMDYVNPVDFTDELRNFIFEELKKKSKQADDLETAKEIFSARGDWILRYESHDNLLCWINDVEFDESLILWHIATELCYYTDDIEDKNDNCEFSKHRKVSKHLSEYLLYLLVMQSTMLSNIAGIGQIRFRDTCAEAKKFFRGREVLEEEKDTCQKIVTFCKYFCCFYKCCFKGKKEGDESLKEEACISILKVNTEVEPIDVKGDRSKSVLFDACRLAKELKKIRRPLERWKIISKVWVELMSYAAGHCRAHAHVAQLSKGGQLLTLIWLLMVQLGLGDQFRIREGNARAKLIVSK